MGNERKHRILLLNFGKSDATLLTKAGFNVELGYGGPPLPVKGKAWRSYFPHPLYEYDVYAYNSDSEPHKEQHDSNALKTMTTNSEDFMLLGAFQTPPAVRIVFTGHCTSADDPFTAIPFINIVKAHENVSALIEGPLVPTWGVQDLHQTIVRLRGRIRSVDQYLRSNRRGGHPFYHHPVLINRNADQVSAYGCRYDPQMSKTVPDYIVLPQMKDNGLALLDVLQALVRVFPELFPDIRSREWYTHEEFRFSEEREIDRQVEAKQEETKIFIESQQKKKEEVAGRFEFIREILIATETPENPEKRLSSCVRKVLGFLGFDVEDIDAKIRGAIKKEDFWVEDGDFLAITEVSGTTNKNPKTKEYSDLLGRMTTIFKRRDLVPDAERVKGLLILNYDIDNHPLRRPRIYTGGEEEFVQAAKEQGIGLLSTVELYRIAIAAKDGIISHEQAREILKQAGRIEFTMPKEGESA